jgi:hypothetical protein
MSEMQQRASFCKGHLIGAGALDDHITFRPCEAIHDARTPAEEEGSKFRRIVAACQQLRMLVKYVQAAHGINTCGVARSSYRRILKAGGRLDGSKSDCLGSMHSQVACALMPQYQSSASGCHEQSATKSASIEI